MSNLQIRPATTEHRSYILDSWLHGVRDAMPWSFIPHQTYYAKQGKIIDALLNTANTIVVSIDDDPDTIASYLCYSTIDQQLIIHWGATKSAFRHNSLMDKLLSSADLHWRTKPLICTHIGRSFISLKKRFDLAYDPYIIQLITGASYDC